MAAGTGNRWTSPTTTSGHPWASFLLGAMDPGTSNVQYRQLQIANTEFYGFYVQDDWKVTPKITLNLGLRYEYQGGLWDPEYRLPQRLDLTDPIPGMAEAIDPKIPADIRARMAESAGAKGYTYNGAFYFTEEDSKRKTDAWTGGFMPRIGLAWRLDEKTAFRAGYGRFVTPTELANSERDTLGEIDLAAFNPVTNVLSNVNGVPVAFLANPFPQGLTPAYGKSYGRNTNLGDNVSWDEYEQRTPVSDRINVSLQREMTWRIVADATYFVNFISHDQYSQNLNLMDPRLRYTYGAYVDQAVPNPFYNYGTVEQFPGALRRTATVARSQLLRPYPQYYNIIQTGTDLRKAKYQSLQLRLQRPFANGFSFVATYAYVKQESQWYFDEQDEYDGALTWFDFSVHAGGQLRQPLGGVRPPAPVRRGGDRRAPLRPGPEVRVRHVGLPRRHPRRLADLRDLHLLLGRPHRLHRHDGGPAVGREDRRARRGQVLVRRHRLRPSARVHPAQQRVDLRRPHRPELQQPRPDAAEDLQAQPAACACRCGWTPSTRSTG